MVRDIQSMVYSLAEYSYDNSSHIYLLTDSNKDIEDVCNEVYYLILNDIKKIIHHRCYYKGHRGCYYTGYHGCSKSQLIANDKYRKTEKGKLARIRYNKSKKGKIALRKAASNSHAKRKRNLKWIPIMDNPFPDEIDIHFHHLNNWFVIPIPRSTHLKTLNGNHRSKCNEIIKNIFNLDINIFLSPTLGG